MVLNMCYFTGKFEVALEGGRAITIFTRNMWSDYFRSFCKLRICFKVQTA